MTVSVYIRESKTRKYTRLNPKKHYPAGTAYVLRYTDRDGKPRWETLDSTLVLNPNAALIKAKLKEAELLRAASEPQKSPPQVKRVSLKEAVRKYILTTQATKAKDSAQRYEYSLNLFLAICDKQCVDEVEVSDLKDFEISQRKAGMSDRTIANRMVNVVTFLRAHGIKDVTVRVRYVEKKVRAYRADELKAMFAVMTPDEWLLFQFFLCTGSREQEVVHAEWTDLDFMDGLLMVRAKDDWKPKDYEEREIPLPDFLLAALKERKASATSSLIFPAPNGKHNSHLLRFLKKVVKRANLKGTFTLHMWRKTYATLQHRDGVDARTIQKRLGHSSLETTLLYLEGEDARSERSRQQVNSTFAVFAGGVEVRA